MAIVSSAASADAASSGAKRAKVTERNAAGDFVQHNPGGDEAAAYTAGDRSLGGEAVHRFEPSRSERCVAR